MHIAVIACHQPLGPKSPLAQVNAACAILAPALKHFGRVAVFVAPHLTLSAAHPAHRYPPAGHPATRITRPAIALGVLHFLHMNVIAMTPGMLACLRVCSRYWCSWLPSRIARLPHQNEALGLFADLAIALTPWRSRNHVVHCNVPQALGLAVAVLAGAAASVVWESVK